MEVCSVKNLEALLNQFAQANAKQTWVGTKQQVVTGGQNTASNAWTDLTRKNGQISVSILAHPVLIAQVKRIVAATPTQTDTATLKGQIDVVSSDVGVLSGKQQVDTQQRQEVDQNDGPFTEVVSKKKCTTIGPHITPILIVVNDNTQMGKSRADGP